ncbi:MAG: carboxymuconolactone decarboxylase family protein [Pseudomonadales bacterium]|nr:carboxymuconolactone decarboxylase family protein [Pseudomonadales bacterium]
MSRQIRRPVSEFSPEEKEIYEKISQGRKVVADGHIGGPFDIWVTSPEMGRRLNALGGFFRFRTEVDRRYIELAIIMIGRYWEAQFEWYAHEPMARDAGLPEAVIQAVRANEKPDFSDPQVDEGDRVTWQLIHELIQTHQVAPETYDAAVACYGERGVAEIINVAGFYTGVCMTLNTFDVPLPEGATYPFPRAHSDA